MPKISMEKLEAIAARAVGKVLPQRIKQMSLEEQVGLAHKFIGAATMEVVRKNLLGEAGLCLDIEDKLKAGQTPEEIKAYYWDCLPWRELWVDIMKCEEGMLDLIIAAEVMKRGSG